MNSKEAKKNLSREQFDSFRSKRRNSLLKNRGVIELNFEKALYEAMTVLAEKYRFKVIPQHAKFLANWGLAYADFFVSVISKSSTYGRKFWIEVDEPHHFGKRQYVADRKREAEIVSRFNVTVLRFRKDFLLADVVRLLDWERC